jgi:predicted GIY-YIG superfamily endonuclease
MFQFQLSSLLLSVAALHTHHPRRAVVLGVYAWRSSTICITSFTRRPSHALRRYCAAGGADADLKMPLRTATKQIPKKAARRKLIMPTTTTNTKSCTSAMPMSMSQELSPEAPRGGSDGCSDSDDDSDSDLDLDFDLSTTSYMFKTKAPAAAAPKKKTTASTDASTTKTVTKKKGTRKKPPSRWNKKQGAKRALEMPTPAAVEGGQEKDGKDDDEHSTSMSAATTADCLSSSPDGEAIATATTPTVVKPKKGHANGNTHFHCYLLQSMDPKHKNKTYIGYTTQPHRRIRQHNGILKGSGANKTKRSGRPWDFVIVIYGFVDARTALQFEWAWQHPGQAKSVREVTENDDEARKMGRRYHVAGKLDILCLLLTQVDQFKDLPLHLYFPKDENRQLFWNAMKKQKDAEFTELPSQMTCDARQVEEMPYYLELEHNKSKSATAHGGDSEKTTTNEDTDQASSSPEQAQGSWMSWFKALCDHQQGHPDDSPPVDDSDLGVWVKIQREQYRLFQAGKESDILNEDRIDALEALGFSWEATIIDGAPEVRPLSSQSSNRASASSQENVSTTNKRSDTLFESTSDLENEVPPGLDAASAVIDQVGGNDDDSVSGNDDEDSVINFHHGFDDEESLFSSSSRLQHDEDEHEDEYDDLSDNQNNNHSELSQKLCPSLRNADDGANDLLLSDVDSVATSILGTPERANSNGKGGQVLVGRIDLFHTEPMNTNDTLMLSPVDDSYNKSTTNDRKDDVSEAAGSECMLLSPAVAPLAERILGASTKCMNHPSQSIQQSEKCSADDDDVSESASSSDDCMFMSPPAAQPLPQSSLFTANARSSRHLQDDNKKGKVLFSDTDDSDDDASFTRMIMSPGPVPRSVTMSPDNSGDGEGDGWQEDEVNNASSEQGNNNNARSDDDSQVAAAAAMSPTGSARYDVVDLCESTIAKKAPQSAMQQQRKQQVKDMSLIDLCDSD